MTLHVNPFNRGGNSLHPFSVYKSGRNRLTKEEAEHTFSVQELEQTVPVRTLDALFKEQHIGEVRLMKIDVEGYEDEVLRGAERILSEGNIQAVVCELGKHETRQAIFARFAEYGYTPHSISFTGTLLPVTVSDGARDILFIR